VAVTLASVLTACGSSTTSRVAKSQPAARVVRYVAVSGNDGFGGGTDDPLLDAWPQQFFRRSLPLGTVFVNTSDPDATVAQAISDQLPTDVASSPTLVTVWLVAADLLDQVPAPTYGARLLGLLNTLRDRGTATVLVGNAPPAAQLPGYMACLAGTVPGSRRFRCPTSLPDPQTMAAAVASYNTVIASDAAVSGSVLVDLSSAVTAAVARGGPAFLAPTGTDVSNAGSTLLATTFGTALAKSGRPSS
jgi:hypothetical protein